MNINRDIVISLISAVVSISVALIARLKPIPAVITAVVIFAVILAVIFVILKLLPNSNGRHPNERFYRDKLLSRVKINWIDGVLEPSLQDIVPIELKFEERFDLIHNRLDRRRNLEDQSINQVFEEMGPEKTGRTLLILGEEGAGKSLTLLQLAQQLITDAERNQKKLVPVVFNLSEKPIGDSIADWLVEELSNNSYYDISKAVSETWIENQELLLLLDGLNQIQGNFLEDCIQKLNEFVEKHKLVDVVVCGRIKDDERTFSRLKFSKAIYIYPLEQKQIETYLQANKFQALRTLLFERSGSEQRLIQQLQDLAKSPLYLSLMARAYETISVEELQVNLVEGAKGLINCLFNDYIEVMFERHRSDRYEENDVKRYLNWLAKILGEPSQKFYIEQMQPKWLLENEEQKQIYKTISLWGRGVVFGVPLGAAIGLIIDFWISRFFESDISPIKGLVLGVIAGFIIGPVSTHLLNPAGRLEIIPQKKVELSCDRAWKALPESIKTATQLGLAVLVFCLIIMPIIYGWHWQKSIGTGLTMGGFFGMIVGISMFVGSCLKDRDIDESIRPNHGIWNSRNNAFIVAVLTMLITLISYIVFLLALGKMDFVMFILGFCFAVVTGIVAATSHSSGNACLKHFALRIVLEREMSIPKDYADFLNYVTELNFLRQVGGGYIFMHESLGNQFAELELSQGGKRKRNIWGVLAAYLA